MTAINKKMKESASLPLLADMVQPMIEKFDKYWEPMKELLAIGLILDPRYKLRYLRYALEQQALSPTSIDAVVGTVRAALLTLWKKYDPPSATNPEPATQSPSKEQDFDADTSAFHRYMEGNMGGSQLNAPGAELDLYLEERNVIVASNQDFNILSWWDINSPRFPSLSKFARVLLMIPMTSVSSESAFSTGGRVLDNHQMRLNEESVEALLCTQDWIMAGNAASASA
jgi:hypothetical protein